MASPYGLMPLPPRQGEANKSDIEKVNEAVRLNKQQPPILLQKPTTPNVNSAEALNKIGGSFRERWEKAAPKIAAELKAKKAAEEAEEKAAKERAFKKASENLYPWDIDTTLTMFGNKLTGKSNSESSEGEKNTNKGGNPNGDLDVHLSNTNLKNGWGTLDGSNTGSGNSTPAKEEPASAPTTTTPVSKPKATSGRTSPRRNTSREEYADLENSGKTKEWYENLANSSYADDKEHEADMKVYREMQAKATADNDGKSKEWYENLANSSYANDKNYEADMKAFRKMQADEIAKNGYYTDSQGVKVYAKPMTDKPKKENSNE